MSAAAQIHSNGDGNWSILENGEVRATYPYHAIRFSILWKAAIGDKQPNTGNLTLDRVMSIFTADLRHRRVDFQVSSDPLADTPWILLLQRIYADPTDSISMGSTKGHPELRVAGPAISPPRAKIQEALSMANLAVSRLQGDHH